MTAVVDEAAASPPRQALAGPWWKPLPTTSGVAISHIDLSPDPVCEREAFEWLDGEERWAWQKYMPGPRRRFSLCRAALRALLCDYLGCSNQSLAFATSDHGKPFAVLAGKASEVAFNVSHTLSQGLIALAPSGRLGIDVEERVPKHSLDALIESVMGAHEQAELGALEPDARLHLFYRFWTFKEALIKALGTGFSTDPSRFELPSDIRLGAKSGTFRFPHIPGTAWALEDLGTGEYAAALAYELLPGQPSPSGGAQAVLISPPEEA